MPRLEIHYAPGDWAALYVDGTLEGVGHEHYVTGAALSVLGVVEIHDNAFMVGQTGRDVAQTVADIEEYRQQRESNRAKAAKMREEAAKLLATAEKLEK